MAAGRPSIYTTELADLICRRVATSLIGTNKLCEMYDDMPDESTIYAWRYDHQEFSQKYAKAKMQQAELTAEKLTDLCHVPTFEDKEGVERVDAGRVALQRLLVDTVKWQASKLAPKIYGDKQTQVVEASEVSVEAVAKRVADINKASEKDY